MLPCKKNYSCRFHFRSTPTSNNAIISRKHFAISVGLMNIFPGGISPDSDADVSIESALGSTIKIQDGILEGQTTLINSFFKKP